MWTRLICTLSMLAAAAHAAPAAPPRKISLSPCRLKGLALQTSCGTLDVPEDREHPGARTLHLKVAVIPALARTPEPDALFALAGGPGQAATEAMGPMVTAAFERVHRTRDIVLVDQRGTGGSNGLACEMTSEDAPLRERLDERAFVREKLTACRKGYDADLRFYLTPIAMQDLDEVRAALGYDQIDLWGGSYGTRAALVYLREHGAHVRAVILDGVAPLSLRLPLNFPRDAQRALDALFKECATDFACSKTFPDLRGRFDALLRSLDEKPVHARVAAPLTGALEDVIITRNTFTGMLRGILYAPELSSLMPFTIDRTLRGDYGPFVAQAAGLDQGFARSIFLGMMLSVVCTEDAPFIRPEEIDLESQGTFLGPTLVREFLDACQGWPRGALPPGYRAPVRSDKPVLLLSGELDPVTPPAWAEDAARTLPDSLSIVVPGVGHGASSQGCVPQLIAQLLTQGTLKGLDPSCVQSLKRPPFFVTFAGPTP